MVNYWLIKSEPSTWSWNDQKNATVTHWDGVRNYQARNHLQSMNIDDLCFFYHSGDEKQIVGIVKVVSTYRLDPSDPKKIFGMVDVAYEQPFEKTVSLAIIKAHPELQNLALVRQGRLSVMPISKEEWEIILYLSRN